VSAAASLIIALVTAAHPFAEVRWGFDFPPGMGDHLMHNARFRAVAASGVVLSAIAVHVTLALLAWRTSARRVKQLTMVLDTMPPARRTGCLSRALRDTGTAGYVTVIDSDETFAFTIGLRDPRIYLSSRAVDSLDDDELRTVLTHEDQHRQARDPLRMQFLLALRAATPYLPASRRLVRACLRRAEYDADDAALLRGAKAADLLGAFAKLSSRGGASAAVAGYSDFASARIARLTAGGKVGGAAELAGMAISIGVSGLVLALPPLLALGVTEIHSFGTLAP
jgi:Zn-dependent protease with chaperone function